MHVMYGQLTISLGSSITCKLKQQKKIKIHQAFSKNIVTMLTILTGGTGMLETQPHPHQHIHRQHADVL